MAKKPRRQWAATDKRRLAAEARRLRGDGWTYAQICEHLDVLEGSIRLWMRQCSEPELRPVAVVEPEPATTSTIVVTTPSGLRIEGIAVEDVAVLLEVCP